MLDDITKEKIQSYLCGDLEDDESRKIDALVEETSSLKKYLEDSKSTYSFLDSIEDVIPSENYISRFWNSVSEAETQYNEGFLSFITNWNIKWVFASSLATFLIVSAILINFIVLDSGTNIVYNDAADEELLVNLDQAITLGTLETLDVFGPWDE